MFHVLVVDGDDQFLSLFCRYSDTWTGVKINTVSRRMDAEVFLKENPCDMVISEYVFDDKNGIDLLRYIRSRYGKIPFILLTGYGSEEIAAEASRFGISAYFMKKRDSVSLFPEIYGKIRDEMKRKEDMENLRQREFRCRTILESQPGLICRFGPDFILTFVNREFAQLVGTSSENLVGTCFLDYIHPEDVEMMTGAIRKFSPDTHSATFDLRIRLSQSDPNKTYLTAWTFTAAFGESQTPAIIQGTGKDVSKEREYAEKQARKLDNLAYLSQTAMEFMDMEDSENIFQFIARKIHALLPHSLVGVAIHNQDEKTFTVMSIVGEEEVLSAFRYWFGRDLEGMAFSTDHYTDIQVHLTYKGIHEAPSLYHILMLQFPEETCKMVEEKCSLGKIFTIGCLSHGKIFGHVTVVLRKGVIIENPEILEAFVNQASVAILKWKTRRAAEEEVAKVYAGLEKAVAERTFELQAANRNLESFSYSVSHDLRAPLRSIEGFSSIFLAEYGKDLPVGGKQLIEKIRHNALQMADLIDAILEFSRAGRKELNREEIDMRTMVREVLNELVEAVPGQKVDAVIGDLPPCMADPVLIRQVLKNLLSNALKFSRCREISRIEITSLTKDCQPVYLIRDNGIGFDMKYADRLFRVFERLHGGREFEGTGIGLAIVDNIIRRHGGRVWMESAVDQGCTCYFTIGM